MQNCRSDTFGRQIISAGVEGLKSSHLGLGRHRQMHDPTIPAVVPHTRRSTNAPVDSLDNVCQAEAAVNTDTQTTASERSKRLTIPWRRGMIWPAARLPRGKFACR